MITTHKEHPSQRTHRGHSSKRTQRTHREHPSQTTYREHPSQITHNPPHKNHSLVNLKIRNLKTELGRRSCEESESACLAVVVAATLPHHWRQSQIFMLFWRTLACAQTSLVIRVESGWERERERESNIIAEGERSGQKEKG